MAKRYDELTLNYYDPRKSDDDNAKNEEQCFRGNFEAISGKELVRIVLLMNK